MVTGLILGAATMGLGGTTTRMWEKGWESNAGRERGRMGRRVDTHTHTHTHTHAHTHTEERGGVQVIV